MTITDVSCTLDTSHTADYEIGIGMNNVRWGKKVFAGNVFTKASKYVTV